ncbi:hypothetical protein C8R45DRAFT_973495 [Mycena sanguinolenta]|nr:hypothetical protein C8R45DRAFT_973495 [Mycena sanguinolenta]
MAIGDSCGFAFPWDEFALAILLASLVPSTPSGFSMFASGSPPRPRLARAARFLAHRRKNHIMRPRRRRREMPPTMPPAIARLRWLWERVEAVEVKPVGTDTELVEETWAGSVEETWAGVVEETWAGSVEEPWTGTMTAEEVNVDWLAVDDAPESVRGRLALVLSFAHAGGWPPVLGLVSSSPAPALVIGELEIGRELNGSLITILIEIGKLVY